MRSHDPLRVYSFVSVLCVAAIVTGLVMIARVGTVGNQSDDSLEDKSALKRVKLLEKSRTELKKRVVKLERDLELKKSELEKAKAELSKPSKSADGANPM